MLEELKWEELWHLPQAVEWERMNCAGEVALYVRTWVAASMPNADTKRLSEARQLDAKIGVSPRAMQQLRWEIGRDEERATATTLHSVEPQHRAYVPATG